MISVETVQQWQQTSENLSHLERLLNKPSQCDEYGAFREFLSRRALQERCAIGCVMQFAIDMMLLAKYDVHITPILADDAGVIIRVTRGNVQSNFSGDTLQDAVRTAAAAMTEIEADAIREQTEK